MGTFPENNLRLKIFVAPSFVGRILEEYPNRSDLCVTPTKAQVDGSMSVKGWGISVE